MKSNSILKEQINTMETRDNKHYTYEDVVKAGIYEDLSIDFKEITKRTAK